MACSYGKKGDGALIRIKERTAALALSIKDARSPESTAMTTSKTGADKMSWLRRNALDIIQHEHDLQSQLCDMLEAVADTLPDNVDPILCRQIIDMLRFEIPLHHRDEELGLFPLLEKRSVASDNIHDVLGRLALEHATDESFASELMEGLELLSRGEKLPNPNMTGYMLRGFFESYRRHIHWENAVVLPLARQRLGAADLEELEFSMRSHRAGAVGSGCA
jgi:hemerythrin-like domain-containing protein